jgi:hypothetical protein
MLAAVRLVGGKQLLCLPAAKCTICRFRTTALHVSGIMSARILKSENIASAVRFHLSADDGKRLLYQATMAGYATAFRNEGFEIRSRTPGSPADERKEVLDFVRGLEAHGRRSRPIKAPPTSPTRRPPE